MNPSSANAVIDALSSSILDRLKKGEPLDPDATYLYAELVKEAGAQTQQDGQNALHELIAKTAVEFVGKVERVIALQKGPRVNSTFGASASDEREEPLTLRRCAVNALIESQKALRRAQSYVDKADAEAARADAQVAHETALRVEMADQARLCVLSALEEKLLDMIAQLRMGNGDSEYVQKLEAQLLETKVEQARLRDLVYIVGPAVQVEG